MIVQAHTSQFEFPPALLPVLHASVAAMMDSRPPDFIIGSADNPYMKRWWMKREQDGGCYIHRFLRDDDDRALHDHPWRSMSILLEGETREQYAPNLTDPRDPSQYKSRDLKPGDVVFRDAGFSHRIELLTKSAVTLFITGSRDRDWGFWCQQGWRPWQEFVAPGKPGEVGRGCGEAPS